MPDSGELSQPSREEVYHDGLTTFWMVHDDLRAANHAVAEAASLEGPFRSYINVQLVNGRFERGDWVSADGWRFTVDPAGDVECWEVDAQ